MKSKIIFSALLLLLAVNIGYAQWVPDVRLTNALGYSYTSYNNARCIATNGNVVHVVWFDNRNGNYEIYYKRSTDGGINWGADTRLTNDTVVSIAPSIAVSGSFVHVVWHDLWSLNNEIYYKHSTDGGNTWGANIRLTNNNFRPEYPSMAVFGSLVHVVWTDNRDGNNEIYYKRSTDSGVNWGADTRLTNNNAESFRPSIFVSGSFVHIVWTDKRDGNYEIYYKRSSDEGYTFNVDTRLTNDTAGSGSPSIAVSGSFVHVAWCDQRDGNYEIYYKHSTDGGNTWGADTRLTNNNAASIYQTISFSGSLVHIVWDDQRDGNNEIYYKRSTDSGINWGADTRLTNDASSSSYPFIDVFGSIVNVVWSDNRNGNFEIYYKRNPTGNVGIQNISAEIPAKFSLSQNYPNPFNPSTNIKFDIPKSSFVRISVFDISGKEVDVLINERLQPGSYQTDWNASSFSSGVYFYKINADNYSETEKMFFVK